MSWLRCFLAVGALGWGVAIVAVALPWPLLAAGLQGLGAKDIPHDPMLDYWARMAGGGFAMVGALCAAAAWNPRKHWALIPWLGWLSVLEGLVLVVHGVRLGLPPFPFYCDSLFCLVVGGGVLTQLRSQRRRSSSRWR